MAYPYICPACKDGAHDRCEEARKVPSAPGELVFGGGICVCPHDRIYASPNEVWGAQRDD